MSAPWSLIISVVSPVAVAVVAYISTQRGIRKQIDEARVMAQQDERAEHARWLRDKAADAFLSALDLVERWYDRRMDLYGHEVELELGETPDDPPEELPELSYRQVAGRLELFGGGRLRSLFDRVREAHLIAAYDLERLIRSDFPDHPGLPVLDAPTLHLHLDQAIALDKEFRAALVEAIQERPSLRLDLSVSGPSRRA